MTKAKMVASLAEELGSSKKKFLTSLMCTPKWFTKVKKSGECIVPGFGKLVKAKRKAREGRLTTGETIKIRLRPWLSSASPRQLRTLFFNSKSNKKTTFGIGWFFYWLNFIILSSESNSMTVSQIMVILP